MKWNDISGWRFIVDNHNAIRYDRIVNETEYYCYIFYRTHSTKSIHSYGLYFGPSYSEQYSNVIEPIKLNKKNIQDILQKILDEILIKEL